MGIIKAIFKNTGNKFFSYTFISLKLAMRAKENFVIVLELSKVRRRYTSTSTVKPSFTVTLRLTIYDFIILFVLSVFLDSLVTNSTNTVTFRFLPPWLESSLGLGRLPEATE